MIMIIIIALVCCVHFQSKNIPLAIHAYDINGDGEKELVTGWSNGKVLRLHCISCVYTVVFISILHCHSKQFLCVKFWVVNLHILNQHSSASFHVFRIGAQGLFHPWSA